MLDLRPGEGAGLGKNLLWQAGFPLRGDARAPIDFLQQRFMPLPEAWAVIEKIGDPVALSLMLNRQPVARNAG